MQVGEALRAGIAMQAGPSQKFRHGSSLEWGVIKQLHLCEAPQNY
jgi:hypothetical protein